MNERIIYECEHCGKRRYLSKYQMHVHETICWYNPKNKACNTCEHNYYGPARRACELEIVNSNHPKPQVDCESWKLKSELEE